MKYKYLIMLVAMAVVVACNSGDEQKEAVKAELQGLSADMAGVMDGVNTLEFSYNELDKNLKSVSELIARRGSENMSLAQREAFITMKTYELEATNALNYVGQEFAIIKEESEALNNDFKKMQERSAGKGANIDEIIAELATTSDEVYSLNYRLEEAFKRANSADSLIKSISGLLIK